MMFTSDRKRTGYNTEREEQKRKKEKLSVTCFYPQLANNKPTLLTVIGSCNVLDQINFLKKRFIGTQTIYDLMSFAVEGKLLSLKKQCKNF